MSKFKVGDRVVAIHNGNYGVTKDIIGMPGVVTHIIVFVGKVGVHGTFDDGTGLHMYEEWLELEAVFNSPLYKALL